MLPLLSWSKISKRAVHMQARAQGHTYQLGLSLGDRMKLRDGVAHTALHMGHNDSLRLASTATLKQVRLGPHAHDGHHVDEVVEEKHGAPRTLCTRGNVRGARSLRSGGVSRELTRLPLAGLIHGQGTHHALLQPS